MINNGLFYGWLFRKVSGQAGRLPKWVQIKGRKECEKDRLETYSDSQSVQMHTCLNCNCLIN